jgi:hypothetical protein
MTVRSLTSIDDMLLLIPAPVRAALEGEFHSQVTTAYAKHLKDELVVLQPTVPQAALPPLPPIVPEITPGKAAKPATETPASHTFESTDLPTSWLQFCILFQK